MLLYCHFILNMAIRIFKNIDFASLKSVMLALPHIVIENIQRQVVSFAYIQQMKCSSQRKWEQTAKNNSAYENIHTSIHTQQCTYTH